MHSIVFGITKSISDSINLKIEPIEEILKYKMRWFKNFFYSYINNNKEKLKF